MFAAMVRSSACLVPVAASAGLIFASAAHAVTDGPDFPEAGVAAFSDLATLAIGANGSTELIAGQNELVGEVSWEFVSDTQLKVTYSTDHPWCMSQTHLQVEENVDDIPQTKKGNPIPGKFDYGEDPIEPCVTEWSALVTVDAECSQLVIAAHAVVKATEIDTDAISELLTDPESGLPEQGTIKVAHPGGDSYFNSTLGGLGDLDGTYDGWCVDVGHTISPGRTYTCNLYSSYDDLTGIVDKPQNMDRVNCLINQNLVGTQSPSGGNYTYGDQQRAIWTLIDNTQSTAGLGSWSPARAAELVQIAESEECADFVPTCTGKIALVCQPINAAQVTIAQVTLVEIGLPDACIELGEETAWGAGTDFPGNNWATYTEASCHAN